MAVEIHLLPFRFPNFLRVEEWDSEKHSFPVAHLSDTQAAEYWDPAAMILMGRIDKVRQFISAARAANRDGVSR